MIYNYAPECKGFNMTPDLFDRLLRDYDRITGSVESVFDAPEGIIQATELIRRHGDRINVLSLNEVGLYPTMMIGGKGCMSVYGLAMPRFQLQLYKACEDGDWEKALELHRRLTKFPWETGKAETLFPGTVTTFKAVLEEAGRNAGPPRPPYSSATKEMRKFYRDWLKDIGAK
jgi:dihydrodipicolinate synthase/N-acetylneuraminate lyase